MQVFKLYFKLLKSAAPALLIYVIIFTSLTILYSSNQKSNVTSYEETKVDVAIVNYDEDSPLAQDFIKYLSNFCDIYDLGDDENDLADALFFRQVQYIITLPYDFSDDFIAGKEVAIEKKTVPDAMYSASVDTKINKYLNTARIYINTIPNITQEQLINHINQDINTETEVVIETKEIVAGSNYFSNFYFNTSAYIMLACYIMAIGMIMLTFQNIHIHRRNMVTPMSIKNMNFQLIAGNLIFVLGFDVLIILLSMIFNKDKSITGHTLLFWLNMIVFSICALSISYLIALLVKNRGAASAIATVISLGLSFISGAFVPQSLLGDFVLKIASFEPVYWFVKGNNLLGEVTNLTGANIRNMLYYMLIQMGFALAIFAFSLVVSKNRKQRNY